MRIKMNLYAMQKYDCIYHNSNVSRETLKKI